MTMTQLRYSCRELNQSILPGITCSTDPDWDMGTGSSTMVGRTWHSVTELNTAAWSCGEQLFSPLLRMKLISSWTRDRDPDAKRGGIDRTKRSMMSFEKVILFSSSSFPALNCTCDYSIFKMCVTAKKNCFNGYSNVSSLCHLFLCLYDTRTRKIFSGY